jgi:flagellar biosynthesis/type III secretory pathway protein FliH
MQDIQKKIDDVDKSSKEKAEGIIKAMTDNYNNSIAERIAYELQKAKSEAKSGNLQAAKQHKLMAEIYQSVLGVTGNVK